MVLTALGSNSEWDSNGRIHKINDSARMRRAHRTKGQWAKEKTDKWDGMPLFRASKNDLLPARPTQPDYEHPTSYRSR